MNSEQRQRVEELVRLAAGWRVASLLVERPRPEWKRQIAELASEIGAQQLLRAADETGDASEEMYHSLFGAGGPISPREVGYCGYEDPGRVMAQLSAFYRAFSFQPRREEPVDHISVEAGFMGYLLLKEAYAIMRNDAEAATVTHEARERFAEEHLARCARGIIDRQTMLPSYLRDVLAWMAEQAGADRERGRQSSAQDSRPPGVR